MKTRIYFLDNLRTLLILLVVIAHSGLVYESVLQNAWIVNDPVKNESIGLIRMYLDLFTMFGIFFISGYLTPLSAKSKTAFAFIKTKFKRLYLPWLIAVLTLIPAYKFIFLYSRGLPQEEWFSYFHFFERAGTDLSFFANNPAQNWLWFLPILFAFQLIYLGLSKTRLANFHISLTSATIAIFVIGVIYSVSISSLGLKGWHHSVLFHFQREKLLIYFMVFLFGSLCYKLQVFQKDSKNKRQYILINVVLTVVLTVFTVVALNSFFNLIDPSRKYYFISEFTDRILYYSSALLSQLSFLYVLLYSFRFSLNKTNTLLNELNSNSYTVYIMHLPVIGIIALTLLSIPIPAMIKFLLLCVLSFVFSNLIASSYRSCKAKQINIKTVATTLLVLLISFAAFCEDPKSEVSIASQKSSDIARSQNHRSIHAAVVSGDIQTVKLLIAKGTNLNEKEPSGGSSPLITACVFGKTQIAIELINAGANVNFKNNDGSTPLHTAAFFCRKEIVKALLKSGADKSILNNAGSTAYDAVTAPFAAVEGIYNYFAKVYEPLGLELNMKRIEKTRPLIAEMLNIQ